MEEQEQQRGAESEEEVQQEREGEAAEVELISVGVTFPCSGFACRDYLLKFLYSLI